MEKINQPEKQGKPRLDRRKLLQGLLAYGTLAGTVGPQVNSISKGLDWLYARQQNKVRMQREWDGKSVKEREQLMQEIRENTKRALNHPDAHAILNEGTDTEIYNLIASIPAFLRDELRGTSYDFTLEEWPTVMIGGGFGWVRDRDISPTPPSNPAQTKQEMSQFYNGNGIFISDDELLSNHHVVENLLPYNHPETQRLEYLRAETKTDAALVKFPSNRKPRHAYPREEWADEKDFQGEIFINPAIDPDWSSATDGTKLAISAAIRVTPHLADYLKRKTKLGESASELVGSYLYIRPPGEYFHMPKALQEPTQVGWGNYPSEILNCGTSGSPVFLDKKFAGLNSHHTLLEGDGMNPTPLELGFFEGTRKVAKAIDVGMQVRIADLPHPSPTMASPSGTARKYMMDSQESDGYADFYDVEVYDVTSDPAQVYRDIIRRRRMRMK